MKNEGISAMAFLFIVPLLFIIGCFIFDFAIIFKEKSKLNDKMDYIVDLYEKDDIQRIVSYSHEQDIKVDYIKQENKVKLVLTKQVKLKTPVLKYLFGNTYKIEKVKIVTKE